MKTLASLFPSSFSSSAPLQTAAPWRILGLLAALVVLVHALVLGSSPTHVGSAPKPTPKQVSAMLTRSITLPPPPMQVGPAPTSEKPAAKPAPKEKAAVAPEPPALSMDAPEEPVQQPSSAELFVGPTDDPGQPTLNPSTAASSKETPPAPPANAPPAGPSQTVVTALPASVLLGYQTTGSAKGLTYHAKGELAWHNNNTSYDASMTVSALFVGSRSMASQGQVSPEGLSPSRFSDKSRTEVAAHFDPDKGQVSFSANTPSVPWVKGGQDRVSVFMQLGGMLAGNPAGFPAGASISLYTVGPRDADTWTFRVEGEEMLSLPFGELATLKLSRQLRHEYDQKLEVWYAPSLGYLPVRNKITQTNGDFVDQQLSAVSNP